MREINKEYFSLIIPPWPEYVVGKYCHFSKNEKHITRCFSEYVMIFMLKNTLYFSEDDRNVVLRPGEWYIQLPGLLQEGKVPSPYAEYFYIHFKGSHVHLHDSKENNSNPEEIRRFGRFTLPVRGKFNPEEFVPMFDKLNILSINADNCIAEQAAFLEIVNKLAKSNLKPRTKEQTLAKQLKEYLALNFSKNISLTELDSVFGYSPDYLTKVFKKEYGITPSYYLKTVRVSKAKELLKHTEKSIQEITDLSGYNDKTVFFRAFKQLTGVSPSTWRKMHKFV